MTAERGPYGLRAALGSLRVRIVVVFLVLLTAAAIVAFLVIRGVLLARLDERVAAELAQEAEELDRFVSDGVDPVDGEPFGADITQLLSVFLQRNVPSRNEAFLAYVPASQTFIRDLGQPRIALYDDPAFRERIAAVRSGERGRVAVTAPEGGTEQVEYLAKTLQSPDGEVLGVFTVAAFLSPQLAEVSEVSRVLAAVGLGVLLLAGSVLWALAGRLLEPVRELTDTARAISDSDLSRRIAVQGSDEIGQLAVTFNAMLDRLEEAFASQRDFVNDAGHELRTPITIMRGHLDLLDGGLADREETVPILRDELARMSRFVEDLLLLAKARRPDFLDLSAVDVGALTSELVAKAASLAPRTWTLEASGRGRVIADRQRLTQAVMQFAQNATQHTRDGDEIALGSTVAGGEARFWVRDTGAGVREQDRARIFERFARGREGRRRSEGAGLGLAIVKAIAEAHHGHVELHSRAGAGATFTLVVPVDQPENGDGRQEAHR